MVTWSLCLCPRCTGGGQYDWGKGVIIAGGATPPASKPRVTLQIGQGILDPPASGPQTVLMKYDFANLSHSQFEDLCRDLIGAELEVRFEDYVVSGLIDFSDIAYDEHADLLYELGGQVARHFLTYLSETDAGQVLSLHQREIARAVHAQMQDHFWQDEAVEYHHEIRQGFTELKETAFTASREAPLDFRVPPADKSNMARYLFGGFAKCLSTVTKFHSDSERKLAVILEREALKWLRPAKGQFQMYYRSGHDHLEYQPDFVAETDDYILMLEPKMATQMKDKDVLAKRDVAIQWCAWASEHARSYEGKPWRYVLIPHDAIAENMTLEFLMKQFG